MGIKLRQAIYYKYFSPTISELSSLPINHKHFGTQFLDFIAYDPYESKSDHDSHKGIESTIQCVVLWRKYDYGISSSLSK